MIKRVDGELIFNSMEEREELIALRELGISNPLLEKYLETELSRPILHDELSPYYEIPHGTHRYMYEPERAFIITSSICYMDGSTYFSYKLSDGRVKTISFYNKKLEDLMGNAIITLAPGLSTSYYDEYNMKDVRFYCHKDHVGKGLQKVARNNMSFLCIINWDKDTFSISYKDSNGELQVEFIPRKYCYLFIK
jgi:hypothetical protein